MLGLAQGAFEKAVPYTFERKQFGQAVGTFQGLSFQQARAACEIEAARLLTYNAARRKEEGKTFTREAAIAKLVASEVAQKVSGAAIEWAGGVGFTRETGIEKYWRDSKIVSARTRVDGAGFPDHGFAYRARFTRGHPIFSYRRSRSTFRSSTHSGSCCRRHHRANAALGTYGPYPRLGKPQCNHSIDVLDTTHMEVHNILA